MPLRRLSIRRFAPPGVGFALGLVAASACGDRASNTCGPSSALVVRVIDGDTVELEGGERVRYLLVDTPEATNGKNDCYGAEATAFNRQLVEGREVTLRYDVECRDPYDRILAHVEVDGRHVNRLLVERGFACVLVIPPNGEDEADLFEALEDQARAGSVGMWGSCGDVTCD